MRPFAALDAKKLRADLDPTIIGCEIIALNETTSTNDEILKRANGGAPEGFVVFADHQTAGRGQRDNSWESAHGLGLWFSFLLRPKIDIGDSPRLLRWSTRAISDTISKEFSLPARVKLPNDVTVAGKKIAGVLVEMRAQKNAPHIAIVGIGLNVNHQVQDFSEPLRDRATSLAIALNREIDRHQLAVTLLKNLDQSYARDFR
ncbi:MAG TPA: biotin--[acetyl-CoA-carboxylase] ligase [Chthoniobacterales bacterium]|jgi:BirA family biotin operon repressor/biotin-[acetyl-CoA-carboxylase] ligase|nr:biotin--[acetyl-CoA-carboxylase] ligase [Chthoniobacterales bacterium]